MTAKLILSIERFEFAPSEILAMVKTTWPGDNRLYRNAEHPETWFINDGEIMATILLSHRLVSIDGNPRSVEERFVIGLKGLLEKRCPTLWITDQSVSIGKPLSRIHARADVWTDWTEVPEIAE